MAYVRKAVGMVHSQRQRLCLNADRVRENVGQVDEDYYRLLDIAEGGMQVITNPGFHEISHSQ